MSLGTIFVKNLANVHFPYIIDGEIHPRVFGAGLNVIHEEDLLSQLLSHPTIALLLEQDEIDIFDARIVDAKESDLGLQLTDIKGVEDGVPVADTIPNKTIPKYRKSDNTEGTKAKSNKTAHAHGEQPLPTINN